MNISRVTIDLFITRVARKSLQRILQNNFEFRSLVTCSIILMGHSETSNARISSNIVSVARAMNPKLIKLSLRLSYRTSYICYDDRFTARIIQVYRSCIFDCVLKILSCSYINRLQSTILYDSISTLRFICLFFRLMFLITDLVTFTSVSHHRTIFIFLVECISRYTLRSE